MSSSRSIWSSSSKKSTSSAKKRDTLVQGKVKKQLILSDSLLIPIHVTLFHVPEKRGNSNNYFRWPIIPFFTTVKGIFLNVIFMHFWDFWFLYLCLCVYNFLYRCGAKNSPAADSHSFNCKEDYVQIWVRPESCGNWLPTSRLEWGHVSNENSSYQSCGIQ